AGVREIVVVGRRGPVQAAWTPVEVGELGELEGADVIVDPADLELDEASEAELAAAPPTVRRSVDHLRDYAGRAPSGKPRAIRLRFLRSPAAILGGGKVEALELVRNELAEGRAVPTEERETIECGIVFRSVGYRGVPLPGVAFDERSGTIPNDRGRVEPGTYVAGWIKRGPSGVIGTNKKDATETVSLLLDDARAGLLPPRGEETLEQLLEERGVEAVVYGGWEAIDRAERGAGEPHGRPRVKLCSWDELLAAARSM
ncbi:MAG: ferredoxin/flavodoxin---NADP+ reductase, partial [Blastocatellia bacterium]|nr:ferredoxin/flavodoxin---NADP+ reductase [Blastocatellia bacterium]